MSPDRDLPLEPDPSLIPESDFPDDPSRLDPRDDEESDPFLIPEEEEPRDPDIPRESATTVIESSSSLRTSCSECECSWD